MCVCICTLYQIWYYLLHIILWRDDTVLEETFAHPMWCVKLFYTGCFDEMTLYQERILFTLRDVCSPEACQKLCADHPGCFFFMHHATTRVCRLMRGRSGTSIPRRRERFPFVSGPFSCFGETINIKNIFKWSVEYISILMQDTRTWNTEYYFILHFIWMMIV